MKKNHKWKKSVSKTSTLKSSKTKVDVGCLNIVVFCYVFNIMSVSMRKNYYIQASNSFIDFENLNARIFEIRFIHIWLFSFYIRGFGMSEIQYSLFKTLSIVILVFIPIFLLLLFIQIFFETKFIWYTFLLFLREIIFYRDWRIFLLRIICYQLMIIIVL